jgi:hypothetical protein
MTAREQFQNSDHGKGWQDVADSARFQAAKSAAFVHFTTKVLSVPETTEQAAANEWRRQGAWAALNILETLTLKDEPKRQTNTGNLT